MYESVHTWIWICVKKSSSILFFLFVGLLRWNADYESHRTYAFLYISEILTIERDQAEVREKTAVNEKEVLHTHNHEGTRSQTHTHMYTWTHTYTRTHTHTPHTSSFPLSITHTRTSSLYCLFSLLLASCLSLSLSLLFPFFLVQSRFSQCCVYAC